jgi:hypothetical protein
LSSPPHPESTASVAAISAIHRTPLHIPGIQSGKAS